VSQPVHAVAVETMTALVRTLSTRPLCAEAWAAAGEILYSLGELPGAVTCLARAEHLAPRLDEVARRLARARKEQRAAERHPAGAPSRRAPRETVARMLGALGTTLTDTPPFDTPVALLRRAVEVHPKLGVAYAHLGGVLIKADRLDEGIASLRRAIEIDPDDAPSRLNLGTGLVLQGQHADGIAQIRRAIALRPDDPTYRSFLLFNLSFAPNPDPVALLEEAREWDRRHGVVLTAKAPAHPNDRAPDRRLRVGYVSPDFRMHCQRFFTVPLFSHHDREGFDVVLYSSVRRPDAITERLRGLASEWYDIGSLDDDAAAARIRSHRIDILVDLTMHMANSRLPLFARKPAPVQVAWLAYPGTTGLSAMDYRITDVHLDPPELGTDVPYTERSVHLPDTFWCYDPLVREPEVGPLPALAAGHVTFGCLNNFAKVSAGALQAWTRVLREVPDSRLLLLAPPGDARRRTLESFEASGVARERVAFEASRPHEKYLATYRRIDVGLDPFPCNGHTTSLDAFWMGVPVVTLVGPTAVGRAGLCQTRNLGLPELVARDPDEYVRIAVDLTRDRIRLGELRATLRARMEASPLMDGARFARNLEAAYREMWRRWCAEAEAGA